MLAAGRSSRMGEPKGLVAFQGRPWLLAQLDALALAGQRAVVVLGADRARYLQLLPDLPARATLAYNDDPDRGPFSSLQCGLAARCPGSPVFVLPVDVPAAAPEVWAALYQALQAPAREPGLGPDAAVPELEGRGGHPVLLAASAAQRLAGRPSGSRLDAELALLRVARVAVHDPRVRLNLNAPLDWGKLQGGATAYGADPGHRRRS